LAAFASIVAAACGSGLPDAPPPPDVSKNAGGLSVVGFTDFPGDDERAHGLSGVAWDEDEGVLWALADNAPRLVSLVPSPGFEHWTIRDGITVSWHEQWDGEGLALAPAGGFYVADEASSQVLVLDRSGVVEGTVELPAHFAEARRNRSLESLSLSPDGRFLFTMNEDALPADGPPADTNRGAVLRLLRIDLASGHRTERAYLTDPIFTAGRGNLGVSDIAALSETRLVIMERAWVKGVGNSVRLFTVDLADGPDVLGEPSLDAPTHALPKRLLLDLADLPDAPFPERPEEPQPARALANFEGLALGPAFDDGTRLLFLQSDDNARPTQVCRLLVLRGRVP
jgi:hypothetical protein